MRVVPALAAASALAVAAPAAGATDPWHPLPRETATPQAIASNAEFLAYLPPPETPVRVCVIDTGVDLVTDVAASIHKRVSVDEENDPGGHEVDGGNRHGTYVAGAIASRRDGRGVTGIWPWAEVVSVRAFGTITGTTSVAEYLRALDTCEEAANAMKIINFSVAGDESSAEALSELRNRIERQLQEDRSVVAAVGNDASHVGYPARFPGVLSVSGTSSMGCPYRSGTDVVLAVAECYPALSSAIDQAQFARGTSFLAPIVAGAVAALRAYAPRLTARQAEEIIVASAGSIGGQRVLDVEAAFRAAGLGALVDRYAPPPLPGRTDRAAGQPVTGSAATPGPPRRPLSLGRLVVHREQLPAPLVRWRTRKTRLVVRVQNRPAGARVVWSYGRRRGAVTGSRLSLRLIGRGVLRLQFVAEGRRSSATHVRIR